MLIYSKNILFRGNMTCLEEKKLSRVMCVTNDQLPTMANTMSTVSTNCLTMAHFSPDPLNAIVSYNWLGNLVRNIVDRHNTALRSGIGLILKDKLKLNADSIQYKIAALYLDPSFGGVCGMALTRFQIKMFPDPNTESLSFWKIIYRYRSTESPILRNLASRIGNPKINKNRDDHFDKLLEDPKSLNLFRGLSAMNLVKMKYVDASSILNIKFKTKSFSSRSCIRLIM